MKYLTLSFFFALILLISFGCNSSKKSRKRAKSNSSRTSTQKSKRAVKAGKNKTDATTKSGNSKKKDIEVQINTEEEENAVQFGNKSDIYFKVVNATSKKSVGGAPGSGYNIRYVIKVKLIENAEIKLIDLWVKDKNSIPLTSYQKLGNIVGSEAEYIANYKYITPQMLEKIKEAGETVLEGKPAPIKFDGEALISYKVNGAIEYRVLPAISSKKTQYMP